MRVDALRNGRIVTALVMLLIFLTMSLIALGFPPKARLMPLLFGVPGTLMALIELVKEIRLAPHNLEDTGLSAEERNMFLWIGLFFAGILAFGFIYAAPLLVFAFLRLGRQESLSVAGISAAATWSVLYGFFEWGFEIPLFPGLVVEWLLG